MNYKWLYQIPLVIVFSPVVALAFGALCVWYITYDLLFYEHPTWYFDDMTPDSAYQPRYKRASRA